MADTKKICVICTKEYEGYGNNAEPVKEGVCCDPCNLIVIQKRLSSVTYTTVYCAGGCGVTCDSRDYGKGYCSRECAYGSRY